MSKENVKGGVLFGSMAISFRICVGFVSDLRRIRLDPRIGYYYIVSQSCGSNPASATGLGHVSAAARVEIC